MVIASRASRLGLSVALAALLAACGGSHQSTPGPASGAQPPLVGYYKVGQPYRIKGRWYRPEYDPNYSRVGIASWYGADFHGLPTANGEVFDKERISAAHPTLPLPSTVRVTNLENGRSLDIRVNDRGPFIDDRLIDLSEAAARELGYDGKGLARVRVDFLALADARGTPPAPAVAEPPRALAAPAPALAPRPSRGVRLAALDPPATSRRPPAAACSAGPQLVQIGAFGETDQVSAAMATVEGLERVRVEPAFAGTRAVARVRLGPVADGDAAARLLERVVALGYTDAFLVPAAGDGRAAAALPVSC